MLTTSPGRLLLLAAGLALLTAQPCAAAPGRPPRPSVKLDTLYQLCSLRQREIIAHGKAVSEAGLDYVNAKNAADKTRLMQVIQGSRQAGLQAELSWQRLGCFDLLYRSAEPAGR